MVFNISRNAKIGFVVTLTITIFILGLNYLKGKNFYKPQKEYFVVYKKIDGLVESSPILLNGFKVGQVRSIDFHSDNSGDLVVGIVVEEKELNLPKYTIARIFGADLMGTKAIDLILGETSEIHEIGDTLLPAIEGSLKEQVSIQMLPIKNQAEDLMKEMQEAIEVIKQIFKEESDLQKSLANIRGTFQSLESSAITLDTIVSLQKNKINVIFTNIESISTNLKNNNEQLTAILTNFSAISDSIAKSNITGTINNAEQVLSQANGIMEKINRGEGSIGMLVNNDSLYYGLKSASENLSKLLHDIQLNPKRYLHFSILDLGKTVYVVDEENLKTKKEKKKKNKED